MFYVIYVNGSGDTVNVRVEARDEYNQHRPVGGDFWFATLQNNRRPKASIAWKVMFGDVTTGCIFPQAIMYFYLEFKRSYVKNLTLFSIIQSKLKNYLSFVGFRYF